MTYLEWANKTAPKCPRCNGDMRAREVKLTLFSEVKGQNGIWVTYTCVNDKLGNNCLPLYERKIP